MTPQELRDRILETVGKNGGHLASSLGAVEIAVALAEVFEPTNDRIVWDVGHQAYAWKILTESTRGKSFDTLRKLDGVSPFPNPAESAADAAVSGHAGSALPVAVGLAAARDRKGTDEQVVAVVGDASLVNGHSFEALNNAASATHRLIVILNDNDMAISRPAGNFARFLGRLTSGVRYNRAKNVAKKAGRALRLSFLYGFVHWTKNRLKTMLLKDVCFEQFGFHYLGPVDGHDLVALKSALTAAREEERPVIVHVVTKKGRGYAPAEKDPTKFHGVGPGQVAKANEVKVRGEGERRTDQCSDRADAGKRETIHHCSPSPSTFTLTWSDCFGEAICEAALKDERIVALTAGMKDGTGLVKFAKIFPSRFVDVGIAEGHMVGFAAGLAAGGMRPVVAVYSTFLQRAVDQVMHDVCISNLPVVFCVDRAGAVGADGVTHQGLYDIAMLRTLPNITICQPKDAEDLKALLAEALKRNGPTVIRYPRGNCLNVRMSECSNAVDGSADAEHSNIQTFEYSNISIWATGDQLEKARQVAERIPGSEVTFARYLKPFDAELLAKQRAAGMKIVSIENGAVAGGFGEAIGADFKFGWPDEFIPHGSVAELEKRYHFDVDSIVGTLKTERTT